MSHSDAFPDATSASAIAETDGLPMIGPDNIEEDFLIDEIIPTNGYSMLPIVGLGGSAGSITALQRFFSQVPDETGLAFVVVLHLAPEHTSIVDEIIGRSTAMRVLQAGDGQKVEANHVYVIPPGKLISMADGHLQLTPLEPERGKRITVDLFFRTLADTHGPNAAAIILSGADGDGALGIRRIKERGGLTVAQDPDEAEHPSMPQMAINTGMVDWVLRVEEMPARLLEYRSNAQQLQLPPEEGPQPASVPPTHPDADENALREALTYLRSRTGRDFSYYKRGTVVRRFARRMQVNGLKTVSEYLSFLRTHPGEVGALQQDLLISVTNFFRDRECFAVLEAQIPRLFEGKKPGDVVRAWCAGCATGEEAYSLAMLLMEEAGKMDAPPAIQVFATDLAEDVITLARNGLFPGAITADVSEDRLRRFFVKEHHGYRARRELRECVLFAVHDLLKDAPFSRLDLFTCRNLLIYLTADAQERVFKVAQFALKPGGLLLIGTSETADEESGFWTAVDRKHRLYRHRAQLRTGLLGQIGPETVGRAATAQPREKDGPYLHGPAFTTTSAAAGRRAPDAPEGRLVSWEELHFKLIERFAPPSIIVTRDYDIVHLSENAGRFLHFSGGEPTVNLLHVVHTMLRIELRAALFRAAQSDLPVEVFRVPVNLDGAALTVDIRVSPAQELAPDYLLVVFDVRNAAASEAAQTRQESEPAIRHLEREIEQTKTRLRDTIEQYETACEELKANNEELQAMNEEQRSSTEELEVSREELQSVNEELTTVNDELNHKVGALSHSNADLANLMTATGVVTIFLDRGLHIMRYTSGAVALFNLIPSDVSRPLSDLHHQLNYPELKADAERVLESLIPVKREVTDGEGQWYLAHLLPYRTADDRIAGVVLTFVDITETRQAEQARADLSGKLERQTRIFDTALSSIVDFVYTFDREGRFTFANQPLCRLLERPIEEIVGRNFHELGYPVELATQLQEQIEHVFTTRETVVDETPFTSPTGEPGFYEYIFQPVVEANGSVDVVAGSTRVITERKRAEAALRASEERLRTLADAVPQIIWANDANGVANYFNQRWFEYTGLTLEESVVAGWQAVVHPDDGPASKERWLRAQAKGEIFETEYRLRRADGRYCWFIGRNVPVRAAEGHVTGWFGTATDIQDFKEAGAALRVSQERLRLIVENAREYAIFSLDLERRILSWNSGAQAILGYTAEEAIGQKGDLIFTPEDCAEHAAAKEAETALANGRAADERWHLRKDGSRFWGSGVMMAMHDEHGTAIGLVKIFRDQTAELRDKEALERGRAELWEALQETEHARAEAEAAGRAKDHFLAVLSHELRTPLTPVLMAVQTLARRKDLPKPVLDALEMIRRNVKIEAQFIDDMLDVTRIERGKLELICQPMDLHQAIQHAVEIVAPDIEEKSQQLTITLEAHAYQLNGDFTRLQQAFWNLLKNASKFTPEGGPVRVTSRNEGHALFVEVQDGGLGFERGVEERIFNPFVQADSTVTQRFGGLGLGLAITKAIVDGHGGKLVARSEGPGRGATFTIKLPLLGSNGGNG